MTLTDLARELGTTTMTIYRRLKRNGVNIDDLRDSSTGELTNVGVSTIAALFDRTGVTPAQPAAQQSATLDTQQDTTPTTQLDVAVLQAQLDGARALIEQLTGERDELRRQLGAALAALATEQADRQQERRLLTQGDGHDEKYQNQNNQTRRGFFSRLFGTK